MAVHCRLCSEWHVSVEMYHPQLNNPRVSYRLQVLTSSLFYARVDLHSLSETLSRRCSGQMNSKCEGGVMLQIKTFNLEEGGAYTVSSAEELLTQLS